MADPFKSLWIGAIPSEDDPVWKISSEKIPHMTILFLGEATGIESAQVLTFLEHAVSSTLYKFYLSVDHRGTLGDDKADVVFFDKRHARDVEAFRGYLLKNRLIKKLYDSTPQYEGWMPHLTLGYPTTPAKPDNREFPGIHGVLFDRITMWVGDYEGPEFRLKDQDPAEVSMSTNWGDVLSHAEKPKTAQDMLEGMSPEDRDSLAHSDLTVGEFLSHYGIKGMKWGVRRSDKELDSAGGSKKSSKKGDSDGDDEGSSKKELHVSADAERFIKTRQKEGVEMSDREIREALNRAKMVKEYDELFSDGPNAGLKAKVEALKLQKEYGSLKAEMNPSALSKVKGLVEGAGTAYSHFQTLDAATGGALSKQFKTALKVSDSGGSKPKKRGPINVNPSKVKVSATSMGGGLDRR